MRSEGSLKSEMVSLACLPINLMRNRRLSKEICLLIFRFRRRGATAYLLELNYGYILIQKMCQKSKNAVLSVKRQCYATPKQVSEFLCSFRDISTLVQNTWFNTIRVAKIQSQIKQGYL